ncbi:3-hydroxyacyl-CoA dehydrogenase family protein [Microbacterium pygmaeum]|uniref:3-hydroxybutyryl-CoA dehydrogenase n=1 Tax=Microbacterium pygmaeum TaxID=370764 RepID=A0A1G7XEV2_9MICO|nr:3-hydroxyacyl-CoA dehydrogenase family protein [Microbacterium pygmaeum]SDG82676.1 3-hydroxybutyryl-CoA dehydrogenase [Microbacterium pygmaeum]
MTLFGKVAVLGFGTMGGGIAQVIAQSGRTVVVLETDQARIDNGIAAVDAFLSSGVTRGKVTEADKEATLARITGTTLLSDLADVDLVVEAVTERKDIKSALLVDVAAVVSVDAVIATNTSALSVSDLASRLVEPGRVAGLHFFNPAPLMRVVEVVRALQTAEDVIERLAQFVGEITKDAVVVKDRPGFLVNKLFMPYINDVVQAYDDELASAEDIDTAIKLGLGYKMGPLELLDLIGLDVHEHATRSAYDATLDPIYAPPPLLQTMVAAGMHGNKNGRGFRVGVDK